MGFQCWPVLWKSGASVRVLGPIQSASVAAVSEGPALTEQILATHNDMESTALVSSTLRVCLTVRTQSDGQARICSIEQSYSTASRLDS